jgi:hypothetical protein
MTCPQFQEFQQPLSLARRTTSLDITATLALEDSNHAPLESQVQQQLHTARNSPKNEARVPRHQYQDARAMHDLGLGGGGLSLLWEEKPYYSRVCKYLFCTVCALFTSVHIACPYEEYVIRKVLICDRNSTTLLLGIASGRLCVWVPYFSQVARGVSHYCGQCGLILASKDRNNDTEVYQYVRQIL